MEKKSRILIVEDEAAIRDGLIDLFTFHGYEVESAADGNSALGLALSGRFDMILLDVMLPGIDGYTLCNKIREQDRDQPIIMLTAKGSDEEIIHGLSLGADDYVAKPFSVTQLVLRVKAVLRRAHIGEEASHQITLDHDFTIDTRNLSGQRNGEALNFTRREIEILQYLHANRERPVARDELLHKVWGYAKNLDLETRTVDIHIAKLRRKLEPQPAEPQYLITVRGAGYRLLAQQG
ncbi:MAG: response regulator transcription factor [Chromatiales bacterium]|nr:response regulator transcription factor [Chromatiales bacterium]